MSRVMSIYLGDNLGALVKEEADRIGVSQSVYVKYCVVYSIYGNLIGGCSMDRKSIKTVKAIINSDYDKEYLEFLKSKAQKENETSDTMEDNTSDTTEDNTSDSTKDTTPDTTENTKKAKRPTKKTGKGKSKIPPAKDIVFEGTTI